MSQSKYLAGQVRLAAWGYFFLYLNFAINGWSILPTWVGWLLLGKAARGLTVEQPKLALLDKFALFLTVWAIVEWVPWELPGWLMPVTLVALLVTMYFQFQFLTELAQLAERYRDDFIKKDLAESILSARTVVILLHTAVMVVTLLPVQFRAVEVLATVVAVGMTLIHFVFALCIMALLFMLAKEFQQMTLER